METFQKIREQQEGHKGRGRERDVGGGQAQKALGKSQWQGTGRRGPCRWEEESEQRSEYCRERGTDTTERRQRNRERGNEGKGDRVSCFGARW